MKRVVLAVVMLLGLFVLAGCAGIPPEKEGNYALIVSRISEHGWDMDSPRVRAMNDESSASIGWINGKVQFPARSSTNVLPGEYTFQVGLFCSDSRTCRPGTPFKLDVKAGYRYVLTNLGVYVSDRKLPRDKTTETLYRP